VTAYASLPPDRPGSRSSHAFVCGAGSAGHVWTPVASQLGGVVLPAPDRPTVEEMAAALRPSLERLARPRILTGSSLGALIALELVRDVRVDGLVLVAAGFGIAVAADVLDTIAGDAPGMLERMARGVVADRTYAAGVARDFAAAPRGLLLRHMRALARHRPRPPRDLPRTLVVWGTRDKAVPLRAHAELARRCAAPIVPIAEAGHVPYYERPEATLAVLQTML
jgi:pimeloyl-ACP methyl ester carboxylesterase